MTAENSNQEWLNAIKSETQKSWNTRLIQEAKQGNMWRVQQLLHLGASTRYRGEAALDASIEHGHLHILPLLMDPKDLKMAFVCEHMNRAVSHRKYHIAEHFMKHFDPPQSLVIDPDETQISMMCILAERGEKKLLHAAIEKGLNPMAQNGIVFRSAAKMGQTETLSFLLDQGFDLKADQGGAAILALNNGRIDTLEFLLQNGTNPNMDENMLMKTALLYDNADAVKTLLRHGAEIEYEQYQSLYEAMIHERTDCFQMLITCGADKVLKHPNAFAQIKNSQKHGIISIVDDWFAQQITEDDFAQIKESRDLITAPDAKTDCLLIKAIKSNLYLPLCQHLEKKNIPLSIKDVTHLTDKNGVSIHDIAYFRHGLSAHFHTHLWENRTANPRQMIAQNFTTHQQNHPDLQKCFNQLCVSQSRVSQKNLHFKRRKPQAPKR